ncbi:MAG: glycosyltransferase family 9 protein [Ignavibacteriaceae bacterium]
MTVEDLSKFNKILIIRLSSLGDILLTTPFIRAIKHKFPAIRIDMLVKQEYADAIKFNPNISQKFYFNKNEQTRKELIKKLGTEKYDLIIDLQNNLRSKKITSSLNVKTEKFKKSGWKKFLLVNFKINKLVNEPQIPIRYSKVFDDLSLDDKGIDLISDKVPSDKIFDKNNLIGFCPGARHFTKQWTKEYFIELGELLIKNKYSVVLFGGKIDKALCAEIHSELPEAINLSNDDDLLQTVSDMKMCSAIICNDSGLMHVASATATKIIAIFGSTVKEFGFTPYNCKNLILENNSLSCRPCSHIGKDHCPKKHFNCMKEIKPEFVFEKTIPFIIGK